MSFFEQAKHKVEEIVGKVEETVGGAVGDTALEFHGRAHAEHGESALEDDIEQEETSDMTSDGARGAGPDSTDEAVAAHDQEVRAQRTAEQEAEVQRRAQEDDAAQQAQFGDTDPDSTGAGNTDSTGSGSTDWKRA